TTVTITASAGANGSISPSGTFTKAKGQSQTFAAAANSGYTVGTWSVNGVVVQTGGSSFTLSNIQENRSVVVTFKAQVALDSGKVTFDNRVAGVVDAKVSRPDGTGAGAGVTAQLLLVASDGKLIALQPTTTFHTDLAAEAYYVIPVDVSVPNVAPGQQVVMRMRAWS